MSSCEESSGVGGHVVLPLITTLPYFPEYKSHFLSRNLLEIFDMQLILRMREKHPLFVGEMMSRYVVLLTTA